MKEPNWRDLLTMRSPCCEAEMVVGVPPPWFEHHEDADPTKARGLFCGSCMDQVCVIEFARGRGEGLDRMRAPQFERGAMKLPPDPSEN